MNKRLKKIISILCLVAMLFGNVSIDGFIGSSGHRAVAESKQVNPLERADAKMKTGQKLEGTIKAGETYNIRLKTTKGKVLTLSAEGMKLWVDIVNEKDGSVNRYTTKDGKLQVKWVAKSGSYLLIFGAQKKGAAGKFTVAVTEPGQKAKQVKKETAASQKKAEGGKKTAEKPQEENTIKAEEQEPAEIVKEDTAKPDDDTEKTAEEETVKADAEETAETAEQAVEEETVKAAEETDGKPAEEEESKNTEDIGTEQTSVGTAEEGTAPGEETSVQKEEAPAEEEKPVQEATSDETNDDTADTADDPAVNEDGEVEQEKAEENTSAAAGEEETPDGEKAEETPAEKTEEKPEETNEGKSKKDTSASKTEDAAGKPVKKYDALKAGDSISDTLVSGQKAKFQVKCGKNSDIILTVKVSPDNASVKISDGNKFIAKGDGIYTCELKDVAFRKYSVSITARENATFTISVAAARTEEAPETDSGKIEEKPAEGNKEEATEDIINKEETPEEKPEETAEAEEGPAEENKEEAAEENAGQEETDEEKPEESGEEGKEEPAEENKEEAAEENGEQEETAEEQPEESGETDKEEPAEENKEEAAEENGGQEETDEEQPEESGEADKEEPAEENKEEAAEENANQEETDEEKPEESGEADKEDPAEENEEGTDTPEEREEEEGEEQNPEEPLEEDEGTEEPKEEEEIVPGLVKVRVTAEEGTDLFAEADKESETVGHLDAGTEVQVILNEEQTWGQIYSEEEETAARFIFMEDTVVLTEEDAAEENTEEVKEEAEDGEEETAEDETAEQGFVKVVVTAEAGADLYAEADRESEVTGHLDIGTEVLVILNEEQTWGQIYGEDEENAPLFISMEDVEIVPEENEDAELRQLSNEYVTIDVLSEPLPADAVPDFSLYTDEEELEKLVQMIPEEKEPELLKSPARNLMKARKSGSLVEGRVETGKLTGYAAFDLSILSGEEEIHEGDYAVKIHLPEPVNMLADLPENVDPDSIEYDYKLYHIHDDKAEPILARINNENGCIDELSFVTEGFSQFVLSFTVDFHYAGINYSIEGYSQILLSRLIEALHITVDDGDEDRENDPLLNVADVAGVQFSDERLVDVKEVSGLITYNEQAFTDVGEKDFLLTSMESFDTLEKLTIILADGTVIEVDVTDPPYNVVFRFYQEDGTTPSEPNFGNYNYIVSHDGNNVHDVKPLTSPPNSNEVRINLDKQNSDSITLIIWNGQNPPTKEYLSQNWWYDPTGALDANAKQALDNQFSTSLYDFTKEGQTDNTVTFKAVKKPAYTVNLQFVDQTQANPVVPGVTEGAQAIDEDSYVLVRLSDSGSGDIVGYAIGKIPTNASTNSIAFDKFTKITGGEITYADAKAQGYIVGTSGSNVRVGHKPHTDPNPPSYADFENQTNGLTTGDYDGYTFAGQVRVSEDERTVVNRIADPTEYYVEIHCGDDPLTLPSGVDVYALVHVKTSSNNDLYAYQKITNSEDGGKTYKVQIPEEAWWQVTNNGSYMQGDNQISGHEKNVTVSLAAVPAGTHIQNPDDIKNRAIDVGGTVQSHVVELNPSIDNGVIPQTEPAQRTYVNDPGVKTVYTDHIYLKKNDDQFSIYTIEKLLNAGYNVVTLCNGTNGSMPKAVTNDLSESAVGQGDAYIGCHQMGSILVRGDVTFASKVTGISDSPDAQSPVVVGGYFGRTSQGGCFIPGRTGDRDTFAGGVCGDFYVGSTNSVVDSNGTLINGDRYQQELHGAQKGIAYNGHTYVNDNYVNWNRLQSVVRNSSSALYSNAERTIDAVDGETVDVQLGENVKINCADDAVITVNIVGEGAEAPDAPGTVINFQNANNAIIPVLKVNGNKLDTVETGEGISVVWNYPYATGTVSGPGTSEFGHVLAPRALISITAGNYSGTMVGNNVYLGGNAEGHLYPYRGGDLVGFQAEIDTRKLVDGQEPLPIQQYDFKLYELRNEVDIHEYDELVTTLGTNDKEVVFWEELQTVQNNGSSIVFEDVNFYTRGKHYFMLYEDPDSVGENMKADPTRYIIECEVLNRTEGQKNILYMGNIKYYEVTNSEDLVAIENLTDLTGSQWGYGASVKPGSVSEIGEIIWSEGQIDARDEIEFLNAEKKAGLTIRKKVKGANDKDAEFHFDIYVWYETPDEQEEIVYTAFDHEVEIDPGTTATFEKFQYYDEDTDPAAYHEAGHFAFNLTADSSLTISGLPVGAHYAVIENEAFIPNGYQLAKIEGDAKGVIPDPDETPEVEIEYTNTYIGYYCVAVTKAWDDENDRDGIRPDDIYVKLYKTTVKNGTTYYYDAEGNESAEKVAYREGEDLVLNEGNNWVYMVRGVATNDIDGNPFTYTWEEYIVGEDGTEKVFVLDATLQAENEVEGYWLTKIEDTQKEVVVPGLAEKAVITTLTNTHKPETITVQATKVWDEDGDGTADEADVFGLRKPITFRLIGEYKVGEGEEEKTYEVRNITDENDKPVSDITVDGTPDDGLDEDSTENGEYSAWVATWKNLPRYYDGHEITYYIVEVEVPEGYSSNAETALKCTENGDTGIWEAEIRNTLDLGALQLSKTMFVDNINVMNMTTENPASEGKTYNANAATYQGAEFHYTVTVVINGKVWYVAEDGTLKNSGTASLDAFRALLNSTGEDRITDAVHKITPADPAEDHLYTDLPFGEYILTEYVKTESGTNTVYEAVTNENGNINSMKFILDMSRVADTVNVDTAYDEDDNSTIAEGELINTYTTGRYCIAVTKQWLVNGKVQAADDLKLYVKLQRTIYGQNATDDKWEDVTGIFMGDTVVGGNETGRDPGNDIIELNKDNNWSAVALGQDQMDPNGNRYSYRWLEVKKDGTPYTVGESYQFGDGEDSTFVVGEPETIQSEVKDAVEGEEGSGTKLIFLTKLINSREELGGLAIVKTFEGTDNLTEAEQELLNALSFELTKPDGTTETKTYGAFKTYRLEDAEGTIKAWVLEGLPLGTYFVTETNAEGLLTSVNYSFVTANSTANGIASVIKDETAEIGLVNTYKEDRSMLKLYKAIKVNGTPVELTDEQKAELKFTVTTEIDGATKYVVYDEATAAEGNIHGKWATLTDEESFFTYKDFSDGMLVLENLPVGEYKITEADGSLYPCDFYALDEWKLGTAGDSLPEIMESERMRAFRLRPSEKPWETSILDAPLPRA